VQQLEAVDEQILVLTDCNARNEADGPAYLRYPEQALAQLAATGCFNATFYAGAEVQLDRVVDLASRVAPEFVAKAALYSRERAFMKDLPALLVAMLSRRDPALMDRV
jgi:60 kDa SS-A/Ro ribonucleoprotein